VIDPTSLAATSDLAIALYVAVPVVVIGGGAATARRLRGRGRRDRVPPGEAADDTVTDVGSGRAADVTRRAEAPVVPAPGAGPGADALPGEQVATRAGPPAEPSETAEPSEPSEPATYRTRLGKARGLLSGYLGAVRAKGKVDAGTWDDLEEALIRADVGVGATDALLDDLRARVKSGEIVGADALVDALKGDLVAMLSTADASLALPTAAPSDGARGTGSTDDTGAEEPGEPGATVDVWLFVGVNGVGKTTTVGKVANRLTASGTKVLLAAGDTFRAAAGEQLSQWASRADADIVRGAEGGDPSAVVFDAVQRAASRGHAVVLADTAGRLHNKVNLIEELKKIRRVADRRPGQVVEVLLVLDATTGQNGLSQAKVFLEAVEVSGVVLTKLDGTAKGGIVVAIQRDLGLPVKLVGLGEGVDDLIDFDPVAFVDALF
jgi:fused signal recognition particle receptor